MQKSKTIAVFFGGNSYEREISVITGVFCCNLLKMSYRVVPVYISADGEFFTSDEMFSLKTFRNIHAEEFESVLLLDDGLYRSCGRKKKKTTSVDCILNCCHGGIGEGGGLSALAAVNGIPFASPDMASSVLFMDKTLSKYAALSLDIPVVDFIVFRKSDKEEERRERAEKLGYPLILKPAKLGSSIGIQRVDSPETFDERLKRAFDYDDVVLAEKFLSDKRDANCAAYLSEGTVKLSPVWQTYAGEDIYSFQEKYLPSHGNQKEEIKGEIAERIKDYTRKLYVSFHLSGIVRADFLASGEEVFFNEMNTVPGSLAYGMFTDVISEQKNILIEVVENALREKREERKEEVMTNILNEKEITFSTGCKLR